MPIIRNCSNSMIMQKTAFTKTNYILIAFSYLWVIIGFLLMTGSGSNETEFNAEIFSIRRVCIAPAITLMGFLLLAGGILWRRKK